MAGGRAPIQGEQTWWPREQQGNTKWPELRAFRAKQDSGRVAGLTTSTEQASTEALLERPAGS
jgi:hypothetical protein